MEQIIPRLREFLLTYPGLEPGSQISVLPFSPNVTEGNGISYTGLGAPIIERDVMGNAYVTYRVSFSLDILRHLVDEISNEEITGFIIALEQWVVEQSIRGKAPRFGNNPDYDERIWAQGGVLYAVQQEQVPFAIYRTSIVIQYQEIYESEEY